MIITKDSHLDHGLTPKHIDWILQKFGPRKGFFIETVKMPSSLPPIDSGLYGPLAGDPPVNEDDVFYQQRGTRPGKSRLVGRPMRPTNELSIIAGPHEGQDILYTAFGGPVTPRELFDSSLNAEQKAESEAFWAEHALSGRRENPMFRGWRLPVIAQKMYGWRRNPDPLWIYKVERQGDLFQDLASITVVARSEEEARGTDPGDSFYGVNTSDDSSSSSWAITWPHSWERDDLIVTRIGEAFDMKPGTILCYELADAPVHRK